MPIRANVPIKLGPFVSIPVTIETAVEKEESLHTVCVAGHEPTRIKQSIACPTCQATEGFKKGKPEGSGYIIRDADDLKDAGKADDSIKDTLTITAHNLDDVLQHTLPGDTVYYLSPGKGAADAYAVLHAIVANHPELALVTEFAPKSKAAMWRLGLFGNVLTLNKHVWPEDVRQTPAIPAVDVDSKMVEMGDTLLEQLFQEFDPAAYRDTAKAARAELLAGDVVAAAATGGKSKGASADLMAAFTASVEAAPKKKAAKKATKKAAPRKRATKKVTAA